MSKNYKISGYVRGLSQYYQDGIERMEIWFNKKYEDSFPNIFSKAVPIDVKIDEKDYTFYFRKTENCDYLWFCPYVILKENRERLADVLKKHSIYKNDKISLDINDDVFVIRKNK
jgi:hypothetical protein